MNPGRLLLLVVGLLLLAARDVQAAPPRPEPVLVGAGAEALAKEERAFARSSVERGVVAAWTAYVAPDAVQLPADSAPIQGLPAILVWVQASGLDTPGTVFDWWPLRVEVATGGDLGYSFGEWEFRFKGTAPDSRPLARGKFTSIWKKQTDGAWKVIVDTGNEYPASKH